MELRYLFYFFTIAVIGCNSHTHPENKIFRYNEVTGIASLDPAFAKNQSVM